MLLSWGPKQAHLLGSKAIMGSAAESEIIGRVFSTAAERDDVV